MSGASARPVTERLWLTQPARKTALVTVVATRGDRFAVDRSLYCPKSHTYRHVQRPDRGVVWTPDGEKRKLVTVFDDDGVLWHRLRGATPAVDDRLNCHLDQDRRAETARAHTALHLFICAAVGDRCPPLAGDLEVRGGATARLTFGEAFVAPDRLAAWLRRVNHWVAADRPVTHEPVPRDLAMHRFVAQPFAQDPFPGPETTLEGVMIEGVGGLPCDGTHVARTGAVGRVTIRHAHVDADGRFVVVLHAAGR